MCHRDPIRKELEQVVLEGKVAPKGTQQGLKEPPHRSRANVDDKQRVRD